MSTFEDEYPYLVYTSEKDATMNGGSGGSGGSGTAGTVEITQDGATLSFDALKAIAESDNPTVTATIGSPRDFVKNVYSRVRLNNIDVESIVVMSSAVYSFTFDKIGCYRATNVRGNSIWNLSFIDVEGNVQNIGDVS